MDRKTGHIQYTCRSHVNYALPITGILACTIFNVENLILQDKKCRISTCCIINRKQYNMDIGLVLWCFNATFNNISVISWKSGGNRNTRVVTIDLSQVTDKLYHIKCKSNYHAITITTESVNRRRQTSDKKCPKEIGQATIYKAYT